MGDACLRLSRESAVTPGLLARWQRAQTPIGPQSRRIAPREMAGGGAVSAEE